MSQGADGGAVEPESRNPSGGSDWHVRESREQRIPALGKTGKGKLVLALLEAYIPAGQGQGNKLGRGRECLGWNPE